MRNMNEQPKNCPSCGAPVVSEICAYCGTATGLHTASADMEYPVLECKEATLNFWTVFFPMIFAVMFGIGALIPATISLIGHGNGGVLLIGAPFLLISLGALTFVLSTVSRYLKVKRHGETIRATVYGYMDDNVLLNNRPAQIVKLLIQTQNGPRFVMYQLGSTVKPYKVNDRIDIMVYGKYFLICKEQNC